MPVPVAASSVPTVPFLFSPSDTPVNEALNTDFKNISIAVNLKTFGAVGDGVTDDTAAIQAAVNAAVKAQVSLYVPPASVGYLINKPINLTNLDGALLIFGSGMVAAAFNLAVLLPSGGSTFLGNTGTLTTAFDCAGSNNITFRDLTIMAPATLSNPSQIGILFGTSTTSPHRQTPGGQNCGLENVSLIMAEGHNSMGLAWVSGAGPGRLYNVWVLAEFGITISGSNSLSISSTYVTLGPNIGVDGIAAFGCSLLTFGNQYPLYIDTCNNHQWDQLYIDTINGGPSYAGQPYAMFLSNLVAVTIKVEMDYYPTLFIANGTLDLITITGTTFPNLTPPGQPYIGFFNGSSVTNSNFLVQAIAGTTTNFTYSTNGITPSINYFKNCSFLFNTAVSSNVGFLNVTASASVPFFNLIFNGDVDSPTIDFLINGSGAIAANERYFINGKAFGTG